MGAIDSDDDKGKKMINLLQLYRPTHTLGWLCEKLDLYAEKLQNELDSESNLNVKAILEKALISLNCQYRKYKSR